MGNGVDETMMCKEGLNIDPSPGQGSGLICVNVSLMQENFQRHFLKLPVGRRRGISKTFTVYY